MKQNAVICILASLALLCFTVCGCGTNTKPIPTPTTAIPLESTSPVPSTVETPAPLSSSVPEVKKDTDADVYTEAYHDGISSETGSAADNPAVTATPSPASTPSPQTTGEEADIDAVPEFSDVNLPSSYDANSEGIELMEIEY